MQKQSTPITNRNGGMHRQKAWRRTKAMLVGHGFRDPRLYHLVMTLDTDDGQGGEAARYRRALKALCLLLTESGIRYRWRACFERDPEKDVSGKGAHFHVFLLVDASVLNPCKIINHHRASNSSGGLRRMMENHRVAYHIAQPRDDMHKTDKGKRQNYAYVAQGGKLADCEEWSSYLVKARSKPADTKQIYFSSRDSITKKAAKPKATAKVRGRGKATGKAIAIGQGTVIDQEPPQAATIELPHDPQPIDPRQFDLFDMPDTSTPSNQPAVGKREYRVSDERLATVRTILLDPERVGLGDRAISRESGVSAAIVRAMRRSIATTTSGKVRTFERGGKTFTMNAENIGKRQISPPNFGL